MQHAISFRRLVAVLVSGVLLLGLLTAGAEFALAQGASQDGQDQQDDGSSDISSRDDAADDVSAAENQYDGQSAAEDQYDDQQADEECVNPREVGSVGPTTRDSETPFEVTNRTFRVTYNVTVEDRQDDDNTVRIEIQDRSRLTVVENVDESGAGSLISTEGPGRFDLVVNVQPEDGARYTITVEDCAGAASNNDNDDIINVPNKKRLAKTGGMPLPAVALLAFALVGSGLSVFRHAVRRDDS
jgi:cytoskeletal protein RodZ